MILASFGLYHMYASPKFGNLWMAVGLQEYRDEDLCVILYTHNFVFIYI